MQKLGVGLVYWQAVAPLFEGDTGLVEVLELEPQTIWDVAVERGRPRYVVNKDLLARVAGLPQSRLLHGVLQPVGASCPDPAENLSAWRQTISGLQPAWVSEHLSFNRCAVAGSVEDCGFLLPPRQSAHGQRQAILNLDRMRAELQCPVAFETGVNYLRARPEELSDGEFFGGIARQAQCGIVLDLHNLWTNERNGRQSARDVLDALPLNAVWELHLAGGMELDGYWLDSHSGLIPDPVLKLARELIPRLPNLGALIFEIMPEYVPAIGLDRIRVQLEGLHELWRLRSDAGDSSALPSRRSTVRIEPARTTSGDDVAEWEAALHSAVRGQCASGTFADLGADAGIQLFRRLIGEFRRTSVLRSLRYTITLLGLACDSAVLDSLLNGYASRFPASAHPVVEGDQFARFLRDQSPLLECIPHLKEILNFEHALLRAYLFGTKSEITWSVDPVQILSALDLGALPHIVQPSPSTMIVGS